MNDLSRVLWLYSACVTESDFHHALLSMTPVMHPGLTFVPLPSLKPTTRLLTDTGVRPHTLKQGDAQTDRWMDTTQHTVQIRAADMHMQSAQQPCCLLAGVV